MIDWRELELTVRAGADDLKSVVKRATDQGSSTLYVHISCDTFLCMSVHHTITA